MDSGSNIFHPTAPTHSLDQVPQNPPLALSVRPLPSALLTLAFSDIISAARRTLHHLSGTLYTSQASCIDRGEHQFPTWISLVCTACRHSGCRSLNYQSRMFESTMRRPACFPMVKHTSHKTLADQKLYEEGIFIPSQKAYFED